MIRAIIIDDEPDAINALRLILNEYCRNVEIVAIASSALEGIKEINNKKPDLVFLDVEMPHGSGFDVLDGIADRNVKVIFTTAYNHYAIKAIKYNAIDYLLKPLDIDEVIEACEKIEKSTESPHELNSKYISLLESVKINQQKKVAFPTNDGIEFINANDIIRAEADGSYTKISLTNNRILYVSKILKDVEDIIEDSKFFRVHNSHIVNIDYIMRYINRDGGYIQTIDSAQIPLSRRKKAEFFDQLKIFNKEIK